MRSSFLFIAILFVLVGCGDTASQPGALMNNVDWVPTNEGAAFFGEPPEGAVCPFEPEGDCPMSENGQCVVVPPGGQCITSFVAECLDQFTVLSVYTQRPDGTPLCNWITFEQPSLRAIRAGDEIEIRAFHFPLTAPFGAQARIGFVVGDELAVDTSVQIPQPFDFVEESWIAPKNYPAGTRLLFHVDNHGNNEYGLVEANICEERTPGSDEPCLPPTPSP